MNPIGDEEERRALLHQAMTLDTPLANPKVEGQALLEVVVELYSGAITLGEARSKLVELAELDAMFHQVLARRA